MKGRKDAGWQGRIQKLSMEGDDGVWGVASMQRGPAAEPLAGAEHFPYLTVN